MNPYGAYNAYGSGCGDAYGGGGGGYGGGGFQAPYAGEQSSWWGGCGGAWTGADWGSGGDWSDNSGGCYQAPASSGGGKGDGKSAGKKGGGKGGGKSTMICKFFQEGRCTKGDSCTFS